jgi:hypothetical protein
MAHSNLGLRKEFYMQHESIDWDGGSEGVEGPSLLTFKFIRDGQALGRSQLLLWCPRPNDIKIDKTSRTNL